MGDEVWLPVVGWEGAYEVSDLGRVRSIPRAKCKGIVLKPCAGPGKYWSVGTTYQGRRRTQCIHHLVAAAFIGPRPEGMQVCHGNGDESDNRLANLRYDTPAANGRDILLHGTHQSARRTHCPQNHELTEANTYRETRPSPDGRGTKVKRRCKICIAEHARRYNARVKVAA